MAEPWYVSAVVILIQLVVILLASIKLYHLKQGILFHSPFKKLKIKNKPIK